MFFSRHKRNAVERNVGQAQHAANSAAGHTRDAVISVADRGIDRARDVAGHTADRARDVAGHTAERLAGSIHDLQDRLPGHKPKRRSRLPYILAAAGLLAAVIGAALAAKKKRREPDLDYMSYHGSVSPGPSAAEPSPPAPVTPVTATPAAPVPEADPASLFTSLLGKEVVDIDGSSIGHVERVYYLQGNTDAEWVGVSSGMIEKKMLVVPMEDATVDDEIHIAYPKELIEEAEELGEPDQDHDREMQLYKHYNVRREAAPGTASLRQGSDALLIGWPAVIDQAAGEAESAS